MRTESLELAARALRYWQERQQAMSHNLANASTDGYKAERVFARLLDGASPSAETATDLRPGQLTPTGGALDVALEGPGFFVVETPQGERLTRGGSLRLDGTGTLVDAAGNPLLGEGGALVLPPGEVKIDGAGEVRVDGALVGRLRVEALPAGASPQREGGLLYVGPEGRQAVTPDERTVRQGFVEASNVGTVESLVEMISIQRAYEAVSRTVHVVDGVMDTIANDLGKI